MRAILAELLLAALNKILGDLGREEFVVLMWTYYLDGIDVDAA